MKMKRYLWLFVIYLLGAFLAVSTLPARPVQAQAPVQKMISSRFENQNACLGVEGFVKGDPSDCQEEESFGKIMIDGECYLLKNEPAPVELSEINGHTLSESNPSLLYNPLSQDTSRTAHVIENKAPDIEYFFRNDGSLAMSEFVELDGKNYYFDENGMKVTDSIVESGNQVYYLDQDGSLVDKNTYKARQYAKLVISQVGTDPRDLFDWTVDHISYHTEGYERTVQDYAVIGFEKGAGNCYCFAGVFYFLMDTLGYPVRFVQGSVLFNNGNGGLHGWVLLDENGKEYLYDASAQNDLGEYENFFRVDPMNPPVRYSYFAGTEPNGGYYTDWDS